jgi:hypothetical protein
MQWFNTQSVSDLKKLGSFKKIKAEVQEYLSDSIQIKGRGWNDLFAIILKLQNISQVNSSKNIEDKSFSSDPYFKSEASRYIYALVELSGESQLKEIGLDRIHFRDKVKAKELRNKIAHEIHPDICNHSEAENAMNKLTKLFKEVVS